MLTYVEKYLFSMFSSIDMLSIRLFNILTPFRCFLLLLLFMVVVMRLLVFYSEDLVVGMTCFYCIETFLMILCEVIRGRRNSLYRKTIVFSSFFKIRNCNRIQSSVHVICRFFSRSAPFSMSLYRKVFLDAIFFT